MPPPPRRSLRERDQRAIEPPPLPGQTAIDMPADPPDQPAPRQSPATRRPVAAATPARAVEGARRLGIYFHPADFTAAKAAYLADWQAGGHAGTFATWISGVLLDHAQLPPAQRVDATPPARTGGAGSTRSFALPAHVHHAVRAAVIADQGAGRWVSASTWSAAAVHAAVHAAQRRAGGSLVPPPARLPNKLVR